MKKKTKIVLALAAACAGTLVLGACAGPTPKDFYAEEKNGGYSIAVHFDMSGGTFASNKNTQVDHLYRPSDLEKGIKIVPPNERLGTTVYEVEKTGYFLAGWYRNRELREDTDGRPLDVEGNVCDIEKEVLDEKGNPKKDINGDPITILVSEAGLEQGYTYSDPWDFDKKLTLQDVDLDAEYALTLYAAWVPHFV